MSDSDAIDKILNGETGLPVFMMTPNYMGEIIDRIAIRVQHVVRDLPTFDEPDDEFDELAQTQEYQAAVQAGGEELLPAFEVLTTIVNLVQLTLAAQLLTRLMAKPGMSVYWGFMLQHTKLAELKERLG